MTQHAPPFRPALLAPQHWPAWVGLGLIWLVARLPYRGLLGIARTGSPMTNGSGEYSIAFSTNPHVRRTPERRAAASAIVDLPNEQMSPLFEAAVEAAEEAAINSMFAATAVDGNGHHIDALPVDKVVKLYKEARHRN